MATNNINIRIDAELKRNAEQLFAELGMNMTTAINLFLKQTIRNQAIPFSITMNKIPNSATLRAMRETEELVNDPNAETFNSIDELRKDLLS